jgi:outer membrane autotransporter protein
MDDAGAGSSVLNLSGSTGFPLGANQSVASLAGAASSGITRGANTLTIGFGTGPDTNGTAAAAFLGVISGTGGVIKDQSSVAIFSGLNTYTGTTNIDGGILVINGSVRSSVVSINPNGTLMGTGTAFGNVTNAGNFSPGNSPGKFTIGGNYTQTTGGTLNIEIAGAAASQHDLVTVGKVASLAGNLKLIRLNQFRPVLGDRITFLTAANGVTGRFSNVLNPFIAGTILEATVVYTATTVSLEMEQGSFGAYSVAQGMTPNQQSVAFALDKIAFDTNQSKLIGYLNSQLLGNLAADFDLIAPEELQSIFTIGISQANIQTANLTRRMDDLHAGVANFSSAGLSATGLMQGASTNYLRPHSGANGPSGKISKEVHPVEAGPFGLFVTGSGEWAHVGSTDNASGYDLATGGFTIGLDYKVNSKFVIGINTGYARTSADLTANGNITVDGAKLGLYGTYFDEGFYLNGSAQGGYNSYDTKRGALQGTARGSTHGGEFNALIATGYDWKQSALTIGPIASVQYSNIGFKNFEESGSLAPLDFDSQSGVSLRTALGMRASYDCRVGGVVIRPEVRAAWQHEFGDTAYDISSSFSHGGANFTVQGAKIGRESVLVGAGVAVLWNERTSTYVYYDGELGRTNYQSNNVSAGVRWEF